MGEYPSWTDADDVYHKNHEQLQKIDFPQDQKKMGEKIFSSICDDNSVDPLLLMTLTATIISPIVYDLMWHEFPIGGYIYDFRRFK